MRLKKYSFREMPQISIEFIIFPPPFQKGETKFWKFQNEGSLKKFWDKQTKRGERVSEKKEETQLFMLNLGIEKDKNWDF